MKLSNYIIRFYYCVIFKKIFLMHFSIIIYIITWGGGSMIKALGCECKDGSWTLNPLHMLCPSCHHDSPIIGSSNSRILFSKNGVKVLMWP
jgi:hypothetical protein